MCTHYVHTQHTQPYMTYWSRIYTLKHAVVYAAMYYWQHCMMVEIILLASQVKDEAVMQQLGTHCTIWKQDQSLVKQRDTCHK